MTKSVVNAGDITGKILSIVIAIIVVGVVFVPLISSMTSTPSSDDDNDSSDNENVLYNDGSVGADMGYYTSSPATDLTVTFVCDSENITLSGDYSATYPLSDMILMVADNQSLVVKDGMMFYNDGVTTHYKPNVSDTETTFIITLDSTGLNGKSYEWVYFPTVDGAYGCYLNGYDYAMSDAVSVASYYGFTVILKNGAIINSPTEVFANPIVADGKTTGYDIVGNKTGNGNTLSDGDWTFYIHDGNAIIIGGYVDSEQESAVEIPDTLYHEGVGYPVTEIWGVYEDSENEPTWSGIFDAFSTPQVALVIPDTVTVIGDSAFYYTNFTSVVIPDSVTYIGRSAFTYMQYLSGPIVIPDSVTFMGKGAFEYAGSSEQTLTTLTLSDSLTTIENYVFDNCHFTGTLEIPDTVVRIGDHAFENCSFTSVDLSDNLKYIGKSAFYGCPITNITIPNSVISIGTHAFDGGYEAVPISTLSIPDTTDVGYEAFYRDTTQYHPPAGQYTQDGWNFDIVDGEIVLYKYTALSTSTTSVVIPNSFTVNGTAYPVTQLGNRFDPIFDYPYSSISSYPAIQVTLPNSLERINSNAFGYDVTSKLTGDIIMPNTVTYIGAYAFSKEYGVNSPSPFTLTLSNSIEYIGEGAFEKGYMFQSSTITLPESLRYIGDSAFTDAEMVCSNFPTNVEYIGKNAFSSIEMECTTLDLTNAEYIGKNAFSHSLMSNPNVIFSDSLTYIGDFAFYECPISGNLILPDSIEYLGSYAFGLNSTPDDDDYGTLKLPDTIKCIHEYAFYNCPFVGELVIPDSVERIENYAFSNCKFYISEDSDPNDGIDDSVRSALIIPMNVSYLGSYAFSYVGCGGVINTSDAYFSMDAASTEVSRYALDIGNSNNDEIDYWDGESYRTDTTLTTAGIIQMKGDAPPIDDGGDDDNDDTGGIIVIDDPIVRTILSIMPILVIVGLIFTAIWELGLTNSFRRN